MLWTILIGFVVGMLARAIKPGRDAIGWIMTAVIGVGGAVLATFIGESLGWYVRGEHAGLLASIGGAIALLVVYEMLYKVRARKDDAPAE